ncbi:MAG: UPF0280 family protein [Pseudomonas marincola]
MVGTASAKIMEDGKRLHLQHGPIDIIAEAFGTDEEVEKAYFQGSAFFQSILQDLVMDLDVLRAPVTRRPPRRLGAIAADMYDAASRFSENRYVTPMAAVAGSVADAVLQAMSAGRQLHKLYVNNGGDIALHLEGNALFKGGIVNNQDLPSVNANFELTVNNKVGGIATSGWRGRSLSPGIADAVTVLASTAALADVAATIIAGDVIASDLSIIQRPAITVRDDTDLGDMLVTTQVGKLKKETCISALERGLNTAEKLKQAGLIHGAYLALQNDVVSSTGMNKLLQKEVA